MKRTVRTDARPEHVVLGRMLRELRERRGMTQRAVAEALGRKHGYVWKIETGYQHVEVATLIDLSRILGGDASELVRAVQLECDGNEKA